MKENPPSLYLLILEKLPTIFPNLCPVVTCSHAVTTTANLRESRMASYAAWMKLL